MADTLKRRFANKEYTFYRTSLMDHITYYVLFDSDGQRDSAKITQNTQGEWTLDVSKVPDYIREAESELIRAILENEKGSGPDPVK